nr:uncharacterized protein LOC124807164 isoform X1 [Hydra vulgaris]
MRRIHEEGLTFDSFVLLNEEDLRELGLKMGERKLLMSWIKSSVNSQSSTECSSTMNPTSVSTPAAIMLPLPARDVVVVESQVYAIEELLCNYTKGGTKIVENLKQGIYYTRSERVLMIKVLGKYLMKNCLIQNDPSSKEMTNLAKSIVMEFPVLFSKTTPNGYEEIYCAKGATGYLAQYVRQKRHRDPFIKKHWTWRKNRVTITNPLSNIDDDERRLQESRPTAVNLFELVQLMHNTREHRRAWINTCNPDATSILNRFPRLFDVSELISKEFAAIAGEFFSLRVAMLSFRQKILVYSENLKDATNVKSVQI